MYEYINQPEAIFDQIQLVQYNRHGRCVCFSQNEKNGTPAQWKFSSQKGMKKNFLAKPRFEPVTTEFPQYDDLTIQPQS